MIKMVPDFIFLSRRGVKENHPLPPPLPPPPPLMFALLLKSWKMMSSERKTKKASELPI